MQKQHTTPEGTQNKKAPRTIGAGLDDKYSVMVDDLKALGYTESVIVRRGITLLAELEKNRLQKNHC